MVIMKMVELSCLMRGTNTNKTRDLCVLKPASLSYKRHKEILKDYARRIMPYV